MVKISGDEESTTAAGEKPVLLRNDSFNKAIEQGKLSKVKTTTTTTTTQQHLEKLLGVLISIYGNITRSDTLRNALMKPSLKCFFGVKYFQLLEI